MEETSVYTTKLDRTFWQPNVDLSRLTPEELEH